MRSCIIGLIVGYCFGFWPGVAAFLFCTKLTDLRRKDTK